MVVQLAARCLAQVTRHSSLPIRCSSKPNRLIFTSNHVRCFSQSPGSLNVEESQTKSSDSKQSAPNNAAKPNLDETKAQRTLGEDEVRILEELQNERETLLNKVKDLEDRYKRSLAETENVRSRMLRQINDTKIFAIQSFCKDLLEIADTLELAKNSVPKGAFDKKDESTELFKKFYDGVLMTETNLHKIFNKNNLVQVNPLNDKFDPNVHEAVFEMEDASKEAGSVGVVVKPGYSLHERPIRPAKVGIVKTKS